MAAPPGAPPVDAAGAALFSPEPTAGEAKTRRIGRVEIPQAALIGALKMDD